MVREAAELLGVKHTTLRGLLKDGEELGPSYCAYFGKVKIYLYTKEDIEKIGIYLKNRKKIYRNTDTSKVPGRPRKWTDEERAHRGKLYSKSNYYHKRVVALASQGLDGSKVQKKLDEVRAQLTAMEKVDE